MVEVEAHWSGQHRQREDALLSLCWEGEVLVTGMSEGEGEYEYEVGSEDEARANGEQYSFLSYYGPGNG